MTASTEALREELRAAEAALADRCSQLRFAQLSTEKSRLKAQSYQGELLSERQQNNSLEGHEFGLAEAVFEDLRKSEFLCAEARDSAEDALLIRQHAVSQAAVLVQAHALLARGRQQKVQAWEEAQEESEASKWRKDALSFEEQRALQLREVLHSEAEATKAALNEYRNLRAQRDNYLQPMVTDAKAVNPSVLDEAEILQNQLEMTLGMDLWRRMRKEAEIQSRPERKVTSSSQNVTLKVLPNGDARRSSLASSKKSGAEEPSSGNDEIQSRRSSSSSRRKSRLSESSAKRDTRLTPMELRDLQAKATEGIVDTQEALADEVSGGLCNATGSGRGSEMSAAGSVSLSAPANSRTSIVSRGEDQQVEPPSEGSAAVGRLQQAPRVGEDADATSESQQVPQVTDIGDTAAQASPEQVIEMELPNSSPASQKSSLSYSSRGIPSASQVWRAAERSPRSPSASPASRSPRSSPKKLPFKPSSPCPRLITKHPPSGFDLRPAASDGGSRLFGQTLSGGTIGAIELPERKNTKGSSISASHASFPQ